MLGASADGCTGSLLSAHGFAPEVIAGLVDCELATATIENISAATNRYELMTRFKITDAGRAALGR